MIGAFLINNDNAVFGNAKGVEVFSGGDALAINALQGCLELWVGSGGGLDTGTNNVFIGEAQGWGEFSRLVEVIAVTFDAVQDDGLREGVRPFGVH